MTIIPKSLADGQLPVAEGSLYVVPAVTQSIIKTVTLVNTDSVARTLNIYIKPSGGTSRRIVPKDLSLSAGYMAVLDDELTLEAGDDIRGDASAADVVDYVVNGVERT